MMHLSGGKEVSNDVIFAKCYENHRENTWSVLRNECPLMLKEEKNNVSLDCCVRIQCVCLVVKRIKYS